MAMRNARAVLHAEGSAHEGVEHWKLQRLTAIANIPLVIWFVVAAVTLSDGSYEAVTLWLAHPLNTILMVLLVVSTFWHARLGIQVIIEDYVHQRAVRLGSLVALNLGVVALIVACVVAIIKVSVGSR